MTQCSSLNHLSAHKVMRLAHLLEDKYAYATVIELGNRGETKMTVDGVH